MNIACLNLTFALNYLQGHDICNPIKSICLKRYFYGTALHMYPNKFIRTIQDYKEHECIVTGLNVSAL